MQVPKAGIVVGLGFVLLLSGGVVGQSASPSVAPTLEPAAAPLRDVDTLFVAPKPAGDYDAWLADYRAFVESHPVAAYAVDEAVEGAGNLLGACKLSLIDDLGASDCISAVRVPVFLYAFTREDTAYDLLDRFVAATAAGHGQSDGGPYLDALAFALPALESEKPEWFADDWSADSFVVPPSPAPRPAVPSGKTKSVKRLYDGSYPIESFDEVMGDLVEALREEMPSLQPWGWDGALAATNRAAKWCRSNPRLRTRTDCYTLLQIVEAAYHLTQNDRFYRLYDRLLGAIASFDTFRSRKEWVRDVMPWLRDNAETSSRWDTCDPRINADGVSIGLCDG